MMKRAVIVFLLLFVGTVAFWYWRSPQISVPANAGLNALLVDDGQTSEAFSRVTEPGTVQFPRDLGPHEDYQTEWWYYTGNLQAQDSRDFGYQFTIFRRSLGPDSEIPDVQDPSAWRSNQIYLAHFTISDIQEDEFYAAERFSRGGADLAGASAEPYRIWLEDWSAEEVGPGKTRIQARTEDVSLDITLAETMPPVLHGDGGLSQKGSKVGNASYYYSIVQQQASGQLTVDDETFDVNGLSWKDHEYSTSALSAGSVGWDWFSLQLDDGSALMLFQIREEDGSIGPYSSASFIRSDGTVETLSPEEWQLDVLDTWISPKSGAEYPSHWRLTIPDLELELEGRPLMVNQELNVSTVYWEGAVDFSGTLAGTPAAARGYIEMTGYAGKPAPS